MRKFIGINKMQWEKKNGRKKKQIYIHRIANLFLHYFYFLSLRDFLF